jgi:hypothetical protein
MTFSRATPPHRQNQLQRCARGNQTGVRNGKLYGAGVPLSSAVRLFRAASVRCLEEVLDEIKRADYDSTDDQQEQNREAEHGEFELPIAILVRRRQ